MKLLRLRLRHYRGTEAREIALAPDGVTLIVGPNEIGKSSLFEALDLLFDELDNTTKQRVRDVKPVDRDAATEIEAELRVGSAHLTYQKRFHRKPATELRLHAPRVGTWTGREAHEKALALLGEHVDLSLWRALRILQQTPLAPPNLADAPSLTQALDRVAGGSGEGEREGTLFDAAEAHYGEYFTPTGRDRKAARTLESGWEDARRESEAARQALEALEADVAEEARLRDAVATVETGLAESKNALAALEAELETIGELRNSLAQRQGELDTALAVERESIQAARQRGQLVSAQTGAAAEVESLAEALESEEPAHIAAGAELRHVEENLAAAREARDQAHSVAEWAQRDARFRRGERTLRELQARTERVAREEREVERARALLAGPEITPAQLQAIQEAQVVVDAARARLAAEGPMVTLQPEAALEVSVDGERRRIGPGEPLEARVSEALTLHVPGVGDLWVVAGAAVAERRKSLEEAETRLRGLCMEADVDDHAGAVAAVTARKAAREELSRSEARLAEALGKTDAAALEERVAKLARDCDRYREVRDATTPLPADLESAERATEATAREAERARASTEELDRRHADASRRFAHYEQHRSETRTRLELAERNRSDLTLRLEEARSQEGDEVLETNRDAASERVRELDARVQEARRALTEREPDAIESRAHERRDARDALARELRELQDGWVRVGERLEIAGNEGRFERLQEAERNRASAERALDRYRRRASAAARLFTALRDAREAQRRHYAAPLADTIAAMGRPLYGTDFGVELDEELAVARRIAGGTALAPRQLSTGAQEQLSLLTRLAAAKLAGDVPLWLDDALGHTDPQRLAALGPLIAAAGKAHQVLVLTCDPERFRSVTGARIVALD
ncbi:MAG: AAA family ATPase [Myxococcota bacterium]